MRRVAGTEHPQIAHTAVRSRLGVLGAGVALAVVLVAASCTNTPSAGADELRVLKVTGPAHFQTVSKGKPVTISLLGIEVAPEQENAAVPCLRTQAQKELDHLLPIGSTVKLDRVPAYDVALAGVHNSQGRFVNAELVAAGIAIPHDDTPGPANEIAEIAAAHLKARAAKVGYYSDQIACTVPGQVAAISACGRPESVGTARTTAATTATTTAPPTTATATSSLTKPSAEEETITALLVTAENLASDLRIADSNRFNIQNFAMKALSSDDIRSYSTMLSQHVSACTARQAALINARRAAYYASVSASEAPSVSEESRRDRESRSSELAASRSSASAAAVSESKQSAVESSQSAASASSRSAAAASRESESSASAAQDPPSNDQSSGGDDGYTGRRCYAPGGRTYTRC